MSFTSLQKNPSQNSRVTPCIYAGFFGTLAGFDHGVGHSLLLLYDAKTSHGENINDFNLLDYDPSTASTSLF
jgi:hypothetical protein